MVTSHHRADVPTASQPAMLHKRDADGGAIGVILILLTVGWILAVFFFVVCVKLARARRHEKRGRRAGFAKHQGGIPRSQRAWRTNARTASTAQLVGLGIAGAGLEPDLEAGHETLAPTPTPPPSYHTNSLRSQRSARSGTSRHLVLANRTMRSGANATTQSRPP
jgi:hypothetical protein